MLAADPSGLAAASSKAAAKGTQGITSGTFAVVPTQLATPLAAPLVLTYAAVLTPPAQYFDAVNTGSITLVGATYSATVVGGNLATPSLKLESCSATWNETTGSCSGSVTQIGTWTGTTGTPVTSNVVPAAAGARTRIKASISASLSLLTTATISISVSSGPTRQIRAASSRSA